MALDPGSARARAALAMAALAAGQDRSKAGALWCDLGRAASELDRFGEAVRALTHAVAAGAGAAAEVELAALHALRGEPLRAMAELRDVLRRDPQCAGARMRLAWLLLAEGSDAAALELLAGPAPDAGWRAMRSFALLRSGDRAAARAALPVSAERSLPVVLQLLRLSAEDGDVAAVGALAAEVGALADAADGTRFEDRVAARFQLGALAAAADRPGEAFRQWRLGHALLAKAQPFSRARHAALLEAAVDAWTPGRRENERADDEAAVFVVGLPRTGTTLVEHILAAHPLIHGAGERLDVLQAAERLGGPVLDPDSPGRAARAGPAAIAAEAARYRAALRAGVPPGVRRVVDKMPGNDVQLGLIAAMLPGARVIYCRRDLRATGLSIFRRHLSGYHPYAHDLGDLGWWMTAQEGLMQRWRSALPLRVLELDLDSWRLDFRRTLTRVLDFLEMPYHPACERFHLQDRVVRTASRDQVRRPVGAGEDWRRYETWLEPMIAAFGPASGGSGGAARSR